MRQLRRVSPATLAAAAVAPNAAQSLDAVALTDVLAEHLARAHALIATLDTCSDLLARHLHDALERVARLECQVHHLTSAAVASQADATGAADVAAVSLETSSAPVKRIAAIGNLRAALNVRTSDLSTPPKPKRKNRRWSRNIDFERFFTIPNPTRRVS